MGMSWLTRCFWTLDIPLSFFTGYMVTNGSIELRFSAIAFRYVKSWLALDVIVVSADWLEFILETFSGASALRLGRTVRAMRMLRMLRLLRLLRMPALIRNTFHNMFTDRIMVAASIAKVMVCIVTSSHIIACLWYGIGMEQPGGRSWLDEAGLNRVTSSTWYKYTTSLHWSLSQVADGELLVEPQGLTERVFTVCLTFIAFAFSAAAVSSITSSMTRLDILASREASQFRWLRRYLLENYISARLTARVVRNAQHALEERHRNVSEIDVELLRLVSTPLRAELHFEVYTPLLDNHPFFAKYCKENSAAMRKICHVAVTKIGPLSHGDVVFVTGEIPDRPRYFQVMSGHISYKFRGLKAELNPPDWICEQTLWLPWRHCGSLVATSECWLLSLEAGSFQQLVAKYFSTAGMMGGVHPSKYALEFVKRLNRSEVEELSDLTYISDIDADIASAYPKHVTFSRSAKSARRSHRLSVETMIETMVSGWKVTFTSLLPSCLQRYFREAYGDHRSSLNATHTRRATAFHRTSAEFVRGSACSDEESSSDESLQEMRSDQMGAPGKSSSGGVSSFILDGRFKST